MWLCVYVCIFMCVCGNVLCTICCVVIGVYLADIASVIPYGCRWCDEMDHTPFEKTLHSATTFSIIATERTFRLQVYLRCVLLDSVI